MAEAKNKFIKRQSFTTQSRDVIDKALGYVNKEYNTTSININDTDQITISNYDLDLNLVDETLTIRVKTNNVKDTHTLPVWNKEKQEVTDTHFENIAKELLELGFYKDDKKDMTSLESRAKLIEESMAANTKKQA